MKKRPGFKAMAIAAEDDEPKEQLAASLAFTAGGSLQCHDFRMNALGMVSGIKLEDIELGKELGRGASSVVYKAKHTGTGQDVAVKMLTNVHDKELRKQLVAEMQFLRPTLREDPCVHLVQIYDAYFSDDKSYIVLEFCQGGALDDCIEKHGPAPEAALAVIIRQVFFGLTYLYNKAIVHRDMKPANCLVTVDGVVKISDFGSSKMMGVHSQVEQKMADTFTGTTRYMSPERLKGEAYNWPADTWCAGMILLELGMGDHPYKVTFGEDGSFMAMIEYATHKDTPQLSDQYSDECKEFANLCLSKDPAQRPPPDQMVNQGSPNDSHPWVVKWMEMSNECVVEWIT
eukprot:CAMPEP_0173421682 /NCGR_PEP_ID=MMETSP1357-20121228/2705_1 /TAXON_ID=77926 /ORGANISM="Hemiselmis rufescens, Strain PCC563" /LENGTH=343 /DNA_ID=CAMNT_0014384623 /DNA_START=6 /DNA_END=1033 /DNA_ORIENTATION=-